MGLLVCLLDLISEEVRLCSLNLSYSKEVKAPLAIQGPMKDKLDGESG